MDLQTLKNQYAQEQGYEDWEHLLRKNYWSDGDIEIHWAEVCILAQKAALEKAAENVITVHHENQSIDEITRAVHYTKRSITNPENLIR